MNKKILEIIALTVGIFLLIGTVGYSVFVRTPAQETSKEPASSLQSTTAYNYYVSPTGNDANDGSALRPWRTINHAVQNVKPGDTVGVFPGTYNEAFYEDGEYRAGVYSNRSGTENAPIRFISVARRVRL